MQCPESPLVPNIAAENSEGDLVGNLRSPSVTEPFIGHGASSLGIRHSSCNAALETEPVDPI
jgi:hypothetical protein